MRPAGFCILVKPDPVKEEFKDSPIAIPDNILEKERQMQRLAVTTGVLLGIGSQAWKGLGTSEPWASVGDHVIYAKHGGKLVTDPTTQEELVLLNDKDIIGFLD